MTKEEMIEEMNKRKWSNELTNELLDNSDMHPNGRDYEAEDEDGI